MRILIISNMGPSPEIPHAGVFVVNQVEALRAWLSPGWTIDFIALPRRFTGRIGSFFKYTKFAVLLIFKHFFRPRYDIVHVHYFIPTIMLGLAYRWLRAPDVRLIVTFHGSDVYTSRSGAVYRFLLRQVDFAIPVSQGLRSKLIARGFPEARTAVIPAGIAPYFSVPEQRVIRHYDLLFVGSLVHIKGFDLFIEMVSRLNNMNLCIVGTGPLACLIESADLSRHKIDFRPSATPQQLRELYAASRFLINMSRNESFGLVMTEAMAMGTPVIATRTDGAQEQIREYVNGYIIEGETDGERVENAIKTVKIALSTTDHIYDVMSCAAVRTSDKYRLSSIIPRLTKIYAKYGKTS